jgi:dTMP kinase
MRRGLFVTFEGSEGCGKSTQIRRLAAWLRESGHACLTTREPGGTPAGDRIRELLQHAPEGHGLVPEAELFLFGASRAQLVRETIRPALERGEVVVSDRFHDSTEVYQGVARRLPRDMTRTVNGFAVGDTLPDITFLLDMDAAEAHRRLAERNRPADRMESEPLSFYQAVRPRRRAPSPRHAHHRLAGQRSGAALHGDCRHGQRNHPGRSRGTP